MSWDTELRVGADGYPMLNPEQMLRLQVLDSAIKHHSSDRASANISQAGLLVATLNTAEIFFGYVKNGRENPVDPNQAELFVAQ